MCFRSRFLRVDEVLYVVAHAKKMRRDLLGIIRVQAENCQIWKGKFPVHIPRDYSTWTQSRTGFLYVTGTRREFAWFFASRSQNVEQNLPSSSDVSRMKISCSSYVIFIRNSVERNLRNAMLGARVRCAQAKTWSHFTFLRVVVRLHGRNPLIREFKNLDPIVQSKVQVPRNPISRMHVPLVPGHKFPVDCGYQHGWKKPLPSKTWTRYLSYLNHGLWPTRCACLL